MLPFIFALAACTSFHEVEVNHDHLPQDEVYIHAQTKLGPLHVGEWLTYCRQIPPEQGDGFTCYRVIDKSELASLSVGREPIRDYVRRSTPVVATVAPMAEPAALPADATRITRVFYTELGWDPATNAVNFDRDIRLVSEYLKAGTTAETLHTAVITGCRKAPLGANLDAIIIAGMTGG